jgi:hypothetical protein|tara:strand:- start:310 stop:657 length:348 start_codon:yes stop_codon:yes gene_type:complete
MANSYTWTFPTLERVATEGGNSDVIKVVHWVVEAVSDSDKDSEGNWLRAKRYGTTAVSQEPGVSFTAYNAITQDWCKAKVLAALGKTEEELKAVLDAVIAEKKTPTILTGTPSGW